MPVCRGKGVLNRFQPRLRCRPGFDAHGVFDDRLAEDLHGSRKRLGILGGGKHQNPAGRHGADADVAARHARREAFGDDLHRIGEAVAANHGDVHRHLVSATQGNRSRHGLLDVRRRLGIRNRHDAEVRRFLSDDQPIDEGRVAVARTVAIPNGDPVLPVRRGDEFQGGVVVHHIEDHGQRIDRVVIGGADPLRRFLPLVIRHDPIQREIRIGPVAETMPITSSQYTSFALASKTK